MATLFNRNIINSKPLPLSEVRHCMLFKIKLNSHAEEKMLLLRRSWRRQERVHYCRLNSTMMRGRGSGSCVNIRWEMCRNLLFYAILMRVNLAFVNGALDCYTTLPHHHHLGRVTFTLLLVHHYSIPLLLLMIEIGCYCRWWVHGMATTENRRAPRKPLRR